MKKTKFIFGIILFVLQSFLFAQNYVIELKSEFPGRVFIDGEARARFKQGDVKRFVAESSETTISFRLDDGFESSKRVRLSQGLKKLHISHNDTYWKGDAGLSKKMPKLSGASSKFKKGDIVEVSSSSGKKLNVKITEEVSLDKEQIILLSEDAFLKLDLKENCAVSTRKILVWKE